MTFLDSFLNDQDRRDYAILREFKANHFMNGPGLSPEIREHVDRISRRIGDAAHAGVSAAFNADPDLSALADEMVRGTVRHA